MNELYMEQQRMEKSHSGSCEQTRIANDWERRLVDMLCRYWRLHPANDHGGRGRSDMLSRTVRCVNVPGIC